MGTCSQYCVHDQRHRIAKNQRDDVIPTASITLRLRQFQLHHVPRKPRVLIGRMDAATWREFAQLCRDAANISDAEARITKYRHWEFFRILAVVIMLGGLVYGVLVMFGFLDDNLILAVVCFFGGMLALKISHRKLQKFRQEFLAEVNGRLTVSLDALHSKYAESIRFSTRIGDDDWNPKEQNGENDRDRDREQVASRTRLCYPHATVVLHVLIEMLVKSVKFNPDPLPPISFELDAKAKIEELEVINKQLSEQLCELQTQISHHKISDGFSDISPRTQEQAMPEQLAMNQRLSFNHLPPQIMVVDGNGDRLVNNNPAKFVMLHFTPSTPDPAQIVQDPDAEEESVVSAEPGDINVDVDTYSLPTTMPTEKEGVAALRKNPSVMTFTNSDDDIYAPVPIPEDGNEENATSNGVMLMETDAAVVLPRTQSSSNSEEMYVEMEVEAKDTPTANEEEVELDTIETIETPNDTNVAAITYQM